VRRRIAPGLAALIVGLFVALTASIFGYGHVVSLSRDCATTIDPPPCPGIAPLVGAAVVFGFGIALAVIGVRLLRHPKKGPPSG
jgi:hypothetical protein